MNYFDEVNTDNIPGELKENGKWCCFRANRTSDNRFTKVPFRPIVGSPANPKDAGTFTNFSEAYEDYCWPLNNYDGLGILLTNGLSLIDIDDSYYQGCLSPLAKRVVEYFNSYTEVSLSGMGIHILLKVDQNFTIDKNFYYTKNSYNKMELYLSDTGRYATVTGNHIDGTPETIINRTEKINGFLNEYMRRVKPIHQKPQTQINNTILTNVRNISDINLLDKIRISKAGDKFISLYDLGHWEDLFNSQSEADIELAGILSFFTCGDYERIEKLMWNSQLSRPKWEQNKKYLPNTIKRAIDNCQNFYTPR